MTNYDDTIERYQMLNYDDNGNRIEPFPIHPSLRRNCRSVKDNNGFYILQKKDEDGNWKEVK